MSDQPVRTMVATPRGELAFQHYFVRDRCEPQVTGFRFAGIECARPSDALAAALADPELASIVVCPSNPFVSVDPILAVPGVEDAVRSCAAPVVAVSPIVAGAALKGPAAKMMRELRMPVTAIEVARHYARRGLLDGFVLDRQDQSLRGEVEALGVAVLGHRHRDGVARGSRAIGARGARVGRRALPLYGVSAARASAST